MAILSSATNGRRLTNLSTQFVADHRANKNKDVADHSRNHDEYYGDRPIEWLSEVNGLILCQENEIEDRLRLNQLE